MSAISPGLKQGADLGRRRDVGLRRADARSFSSKCLHRRCVDIAGVNGCASGVECHRDAAADAHGPCSHENS